jgi:RNA recognition motif-containing protein
VKSLEDFSLQIRKRANEKGGKAGMNKNLYIGNLSMKVTEEDLKANFSEVGKVVSVNIIKDRYTGISRGFGFVEMETEEAAQEAIRRFSGGQLLGNTITVSEARPKKEGGGGGGGPRRDGGRGGGGFRGGRSGGGGDRRY